MKKTFLALVVLAAFLSTSARADESDTSAQASTQYFGALLDMSHYSKNGVRFGSTLPVRSIAGVSFGVEADLTKVDTTLNCSDGAAMYNTPLGNTHRCTSGSSRFGSGIVFHAGTVSLGDVVVGGVFRPGFQIAEGGFASPVFQTGLEVAHPSSRFYLDVRYVKSVVEGDTVQLGISRIFN